MESMQVKWHLAKNGACYRAATGQCDPIDDAATAASTGAIVPTIR